jgi:hypothetical protein
MVDAVEIHTTFRSNPVGSCIYCGRTDQLTEEHAVAFALGGGLILPEASCGPCAAITSAFERKVLRGFMRDARTAGRFPTRRPKERPATIPIKVKRGDRLESVELPSNESPGFLHLPKLDKAAFLDGRPPATGVSIVGTETLYFGKRPEDVAAVLGTNTLEMTANIDVPAFARMLAKRGYSYAVAALGPYPRSEVPVLPLILGSADDASTWLGSAEYRLPVEERQPQHGLGLVQSTVMVDGNAEEILVAQVKLFASAGATGYEVVVRRRRVP